MGLYQEALAMNDELLEIRKFLHQNPELGLELPITAKFVEDKLRELGYEPKRMAGTGIVATVGKEGGKCILLRADMDALPVVEEAEVPYQSKNGNMHACGHDCHTTTLLGAAKLLKEHEKELNGMVKFMFQPAEETMYGAEMMVKEGVCDGVDLAMGMHAYTNVAWPAGTVVLMGQNSRMGAVDRFEIHITGKGCHGASPHTGVDPLNVMCHIHLALQTINSREMNPLDNVVLTIGQMQGGNTANVIPSEAMMSGTIRTLKNETRDMVKERMCAIVSGVAASFGAEAHVEFGSGCPVLYSHPEVYPRVKEIMKSLDGVQVFDADEFGVDMTTMGSEDFSYVANVVPSVYLGLAAGRPEDGCPYPLHHPKARFLDECLAPGAATYAHVAMELIK